MHHLPPHPPSYSYTLTNDSSHHAVAIHIRNLRYLLIWLVDPKCNIAQQQHTSELQEQ